MVDGQAVGVARGEGHLGEAAEVEHPRLPEGLARASARLAPHARVRSDGGAHLDLVIGLGLGLGLGPGFGCRSKLGFIVRD